MKTRKTSLRVTWGALAKLLAALLIVGGISVYFVFIPSEISGISMSPTLLEDDQILIHTFSKIDRFDIVVFRDAGMKPVVKRVIGMPGDTLYYHNDQLIVNGEAMNEPYLDDLKKKTGAGLLTSNFTLSDTTGIFVIPNEEYFVIGDNRRYSYDSRHYGTISESSIIGEAKMIYYPLERISFLNVAK